MPSLFTDRSGGVSLAPYDSLNLALHVGDSRSHVMENRASLPLGQLNVQFMNQTHGDLISIVNSTSENEPTCDGLITTNPGVALGVLVADCIPLLLTSPTVVAAVHVGRKGLVNQIAKKAVAQMYNLGATSIHAQLGPSICGKCYEVSDDMAEEFSRTNPSSLSLSRWGTPALDLPRALIDDLIQDNITYEASSQCTYENSNYFSYRRDKITGRFAGIVWL